MGQLADFSLDQAAGATLTPGHRVLVVAVHRVGQVDDVSVAVQSGGDLTRLVVPQHACASLSFAFHDFACGFGGHYVSRCHNDLGAIL